MILQKTITFFHYQIREMCYAITTTQPIYYYIFMLEYLTHILQDQLIIEYEPLYSLSQQHAVYACRLDINTN